MARSDQPGTIRRADPRVTAYVAGNREAKLARRSALKVQRVLRKSERRVAKHATLDWSATSYPEATPTVIPSGPTHVPARELNAAWGRVEDRLAHLSLDERECAKTLLHATLAGDAAASREWRHLMTEVIRQHREAGERLSQDWHARTYSPRRQFRD